MSDTNTTDKGNPRRTGGKQDLRDSKTVHSAPNRNDAATTVGAHDLTAFQQNILIILAEDSRYGLAIKRELEAYYGDDVNHGRLYPNLDELVETGLVEKSELDKRTNLYELTAEGEIAITEQFEWARERIATLQEGDD